MPARPVLLLLLLLSLALAPLASAQADGGGCMAAKASPSTTRNQISARQWPEAPAELRRLDERGSADWNNLMGDGLRQQAGPDLEGAGRHCQEALRLEPRHRSALE
ncbi:MAG TPA: hypothetical protein VJN44_16265 [Roseateles sp.]|nr:hypothetical protein [Roseateles sp.]